MSGKILSKQQILIVFYAIFILAILIFFATQAIQMEGFYTSYKDYNANLSDTTILSEDSTLKSSGNTSANGANITGNVRSSAFSREYGNSIPVPVAIKTNGDFLVTINSALAKSPDNAADKVAIYDVQSKLSSLKTNNAITLVGEIGNSNNLANPRVFLQYMNWFGSNCPIDANECFNM